MSQPSVVIYEDAAARAFAPFSLTRPVSTLRAGAEVIAHRWTTALGAREAACVTSPHLARFAEAGGPRAAHGALPAGTIVVHARAVVPLGARATVPGALTVAGRVAAVRLGVEAPLAVLASGDLTLDALAPADADRTEIGGRWLDSVWDIVGQLPEQLTEDAAFLAGVAHATRRNDLTTLGPHPVVVAPDAVIEPFVVFDASAGAIIVQDGAHVAAHSRIAGPCVIGPHTQVMGGRISGSAFGEHCRVHGDVSTSVFVGHANKAHEGFVGHSVIGRWANLGAGTTTSNLKNSYGAVRFWTPAGERNTGLTFLGSMIGDHAKLGIGTMLGTGTCIGAGANVFGTLRPSKRVPPFAWGDAPPYETYSLEKFLAVAARAMARRHVELSEDDAAVLREAHRLADSDAW